MPLQSPLFMPSEFDTQVKLLRLKTETIKGQAVETFEEVACVSAIVKGRAAFNIKQSDRTTEACSHLVIIRYRSDITGAWRLELPENRIFEIVGKPRRLDDPTPRYLELECVEKELNE